jgi:hypothetical protein
MKAATTLAQVTALQLFSMFSALKLFNVEEEKLKGGHVRSSCLVRVRKAAPSQVSKGAWSLFGNFQEIRATEGLLLSHSYGLQKGLEGLLLAHWF